MSRLSYALIQKISQPEGLRPAAAPIPPAGIYWLKEASCRLAYWIDAEGTRIDRPTHNYVWSVYSWDNAEVSPWFLAEVDERGDYTPMGSDESTMWERNLELVTHVGPRVNPPKE